MSYGLGKHIVDHAILGVIGLGDPNVWTAVNTFSVGLRFSGPLTAYIGPGGSGTFNTEVADGFSPGFLFNDNHLGGARPDNETTWMMVDSAVGNIYGACGAAGNWTFGYFPSVAPLGGHVLSFIQDNQYSRITQMHYSGGYAGILHSGQFGAPNIPAVIGWIGSAGINASGTFGLSGTSPLVGSAASVSCKSDVVFSNRVAAAFWGRFSSDMSAGSAEPMVADNGFSTGNTFRGSFDDAAVYWADQMNGFNGTPAPANEFKRVASGRFPIQDWGAPSGLLATGTEYWAINGRWPGVSPTQDTRPKITGYIYMSYPRRTTDAGTRAMHAYWEPFPIVAATRANAIDGDTYFDSGTNFRKGLWEYAGGWFKLLQHSAVAALGGGAAATLGTIGGAGPAVAAQNGWLKVVDVNGAICFIPKWV